MEKSNGGTREINGHEEAVAWKNVTDMEGCREKTAWERNGDFRVMIFAPLSTGLCAVEEEGITVVNCWKVCLRSGREALFTWMLPSATTK